MPARVRDGARRRSRAWPLPWPRVGLTARAKHHPGNLSGGQQQLVAVARAITGRPAILLADEPTGNLDSVAGANVLEIIGKLHRDGTTVVLISHDPMVAALAERRLTLRDGTLSDA